MTTTKKMPPQEWGRTIIGAGPIEVQLDGGSRKIVFRKLRKSDQVYVGKKMRNTYICETCSAVVVSKVDHVRFHQDLLDMMISVSYRTAVIREPIKVQYRPIED